MKDGNKKIAINSKDVFFLEEYPYSQSLKVGNLLFMPGLVPEDKDGSLVGEGDAVA